ncbi:glycoside hydrolase family 5 protein [Occultella kanbiaonis]|uniref:glycoside hydrolase family 5 protein n=1 Tax=Occultella kanbiaonis TaxID=2675754 RepID=UPI0013D88188|nr:cellulase family glycosylhydrolase [Occultella kanbiaonis]
MRLHVDGSVLRDEHGRHRVLHGINMVHKGEPGAVGAADFRGSWTAADIADLAGRGFTAVRLGVIWAAVEPEPGRYDEDYLDWVAEQLDAFASAGIGVILDSHQDLYSQSFGDGAPAWATLADAEFAATDLWSDAYLTSAAVHQGLDAFWANAPGPGEVGLQERFAAMWGYLARRFGAHPALIGYDILNEPTPGSDAETIFGALIGAFAHATGQDPSQTAADFGDPEAKFAQLGRLDDVAVHRQVGDAVAPFLAAFEAEAVAPLMQRVTEAIRAADPAGLVLREHSYFANLGVPSGQPPLDDPAWVYSPHGYDLTVDTPAIALSSNTRAGTIFARHRETQDRLGVPVLVGEWGAFEVAPGVAGHARFLLDLFDSYGWSWTYWCWSDGFAGSEAAAVMARPRPLAVAGDDLSWQVSESAFRARWDGRDAAAPSEFWIPDATGARLDLRRDGATVPVHRDGARVRVDAGTGRYELTATW